MPSSMLEFGVPRKYFTLPSIQLRLQLTLKDTNRLECVCRVLRGHIERVMFEYDESRREEREKSKAAKKKVFACSF